jgi:hypothetical protein
MSLHKIFIRTIPIVNAGWDKRLFQFSKISIVKSVSDELSGKS